MFDKENHQTKFPPKEECKLKASGKHQTKITVYSCTPVLEPRAQILKSKNCFGEGMQRKWPQDEFVIYIETDACCRVEKAHLCRQNYWLLQPKLKAGGNVSQEKQRHSRKTGVSSGFGSYASITCPLISCVPSACV